MEEKCVAVPIKRPSETGLSSLELMNYIGLLPSRERAISKLKEFLVELEKANNPMCAFVIAEWGEGKTSLYYVYLDTLRPPDTVSFIVSTRTIVEYLREALRGRIFNHTKSPAYLVFASILAALLEEQKEAIGYKCNCPEFSLPNSHEYSDAKKYINDALDLVLSKLCNVKKLIVFIDEFEDIVTVNESDIIELIITGLTHIMNGVVSEISTKGSDVRGTYAGRVHLMISVTPSAHAKLRSFGDLATVIARFSRRIKEIELKSLPRDEAYVFIKGLLSYLYGGKEVSLTSLFNPPSLVNPLIISTLGNVAALQKALTEVLYLNSVRAQCSKDSMKVLNSDLMIEHLKDIKVHVAGADLPLLVESNLRKIEALWNRYISLERIDKEQAVKFLRYVLANIIIEPTTISKDLGVTVTDIENLIYGLNIFSRSPQLGLGLKRFLYRVRSIPFSKELKNDIIDLITKSLHFIPSIGSESKEIAELMVENLIFIDIDGSLSILIPNTKDLSELRDFIMDAIPSAISEVEAEKIATTMSINFETILKEVMDKDRGSRFVVSPKVLSIVFLSPELTFLNFIKDIDKRFRYWRELLTEIQSEFLSLGILTLLNSKDTRLQIEDIEVI